MKTLGLSFTVAACALLAQGTAAQDDRGTPSRCADCRRHAACRKKVCRVVCDIKEVTKSYWCVECEEFCAPLPSCGSALKSCGGTCAQLARVFSTPFWLWPRATSGSLWGLLGWGGSDCCSEPACRPGCDAGGGDGCPAARADPPRCGPVRAKKKLVKKEVTREVPVYQCVVKHLCDPCSAACDAAEEAEPETEPTAAPKPATERQALQPAPLPPR